ncbi:hypothetical protein [Salinibius halmophilus]|uniref:hypothetical protein n=1 Tax=Salinibius halmophilus TaxID=1853216 RepID=UPI000E65FAAD|nr:hypothetical protein [Salinibius halmophilus]
MIEFKNLDKPPRCSRENTHYYCDYVELMALLDGGDGVGVSEVYDRFYEDEQIGEIGSEGGAASNEYWVSLIEDWFVEINSRVEAYATFYPFERKNNRLVLKAELIEENYLYISFLLCSLLRYIDGTSRLAGAFEYASYFAMKGYLPGFAESYPFGVSNGNSNRYTGNLENKIRRLGDDLGYSVSQKANVFRRRDNGDGGIDIVAWIPFLNDVNKDKKIVFVGQSAATLDWPNKQGSVSRINSFLHIDNNVVNTLFVPFDMRDSDRNICEWNQVTTDLLFDRVRMLSLIPVNEFFETEVGREMKEFALSAASFEEDLV